MMNRKDVDEVITYLKVIFLQLPEGTKNKQPLG
jgi:hypothetical protein